ncbi:unnamed protein product [Phyllotreta striolata]|uniref:Cyclic nucleotide-binding domain-containing protein n=1 Tax=Phyllotreta striolata TaxID=444603 RepID=A0A9P0DKP9_PHYSR|nr:unnamed protein product [Phyllotreta striolata]
MDFSPEELTPEQRIARHNSVIYRFRAVVRFVMANVKWLEDEGEQEMTTNVIKNIRLLLRKKPIVSLLTIKEKAMLNKKLSDRTDEDKAHLYRTVASLKLFRKYTSEVRKRLVAVTFFIYYGPGRTIVKEGHPAEGLYFLLTGECKITTNYFNPGVKQWLSEEKGVLYAGSLFGEYCLLNDVPRVVTITTVTDCEFLMIKKENFDSVLKDTIMKKWKEIRMNIESFRYFDIWDSTVKTECSIVSNMNSFEQDETVLGDGVGSNKFVYFVTSGSCYILEQLNVKIIVKQGVERYELMTSPEDFAKISERQSTNYCRKYHHGMTESISGTSKASTRTSTRASTRASKISRISKASRPSKWDISRKESERVTTFAPGDDKCVRSPTSSGGGESTKTTKTQKIRMQFESDDKEIELFTELLSVETRDEEIKGLSFYTPKISYRTHFVKICEFTTGSCFNIGEHLTGRRIIALTPLTCLLVPKVFVDRNNVGHIFDGMKLFLERRIPSTEDVFKRFKEESKFKKYRKRLVNEQLNLKMVRTNNSLNNVPYSIRLKEGLDTDYFNF